MPKTIFSLACLFLFINVHAQTTLVAYGSNWKYLDNGSNQGTAWRASAFNDASWSGGNGQLGFGDGDEATILSYGSNANSKYLTTYFRKTLTLANPAQYSAFTLNVKRDDGIVLYINGNEVYRNNMPAGTVTSSTLASTAASDDGATAQTAAIPVAAFIAGNNSIAVEIHQNAGTSSDLSFDLQLTGTVIPQVSTLIAYGAAWKYLDKGTNQGTAWQAAAFNDATWLSGNGQLGYGDGDEATVLGYGTNANSKYITTYFRKAITITNAAQFTAFTLNVKRDDGIVLYINGTERYRNNMPAGTLSYTTLASAAASDDGAGIQTTSIPVAAFAEGTNQVAVEIHQNAANSSDISFDLELKASGAAASTPALTRGPYLQSGNQTEVTLRWRSGIATDSKLEVGTVYGSYTAATTNPAVTAEHEVRITGLTPDTKYYYRFGSSAQSLQSGTDNYFTTAPPANTTRKIRIVAFGDCGRNDNAYQSGTLSSYLNYVAPNSAEALLLLGDNAYNAGTDSEYQSQYFNIYSPTILKNHQLFPAPGNHDYANTLDRQVDHNVPYYAVFSNPSAAQSGGVASGTEAYYSWDWGNIHFLSLDSYGMETNGTTRLYDTTGVQANWVKQDLAANTRPWVIAYWHHPPYTMGSHSSDAETELVNIRQNFIRILERMGVDLIICGHSHNYERSYLLNGHYGNEASFNPAINARSTSSAKYDGSANSCLYSTVTGPNHGTVYVVAGSAGASGGTQAGYPHNAMPFSLNDGGTLYFEVENNRLDAKFIRRTGLVWDNFTIMKNVNNTSNISSTPGASVQLTASWPGTYQWSNGAVTRSIQVSPSVNTSYTVKDAAAANCLKDSFYVNVTGSQRIVMIPVSSATKEAQSLRVVPTLIHRGQSISIQTNLRTAAEAILVDVHGRILQREKFTGNGTIQTSRLQNGIYFLRLTGNARSYPRKLIVTD